MKDHLGNIRTVLTDEIQTESSIATMETAFTEIENALFYNIDNVKYPVSSIAGYPADATTNPNAFVSRLNGSDPNSRIGPARVIKVMLGDKLTVAVKLLYNQLPTSAESHQAWQAIANQLISGLFTGGAPAAVAGKGIASDVAAATFGTPSGYTTFFNAKNNDPVNNPANKPKAYLNILLFDENFVLDQVNSKIRYACDGAGGVINAVSEVKNRDISYRVSITESNGSLLSTWTQEYNSNIIKIAKPKGIVINKFSINIYPNANFGGRSIGTKEASTFEYPVKNDASNLFEINIPQLSYEFMSYVRLNRDFIRIISKDKLEWDGYFYQKE